MKLRTGDAALCLISVSVACAQSADAPRFDVASIKLTRPFELQKALGDNGQLVTLLPPSWYFGPLEFSPGKVASPPAGNAARQIIVQAFHLMPGQLSGEPAWADQIRFDLIAKSDAAADEGQLRLMLQSLLAERFHMVAHHETRTMRVDFLSAGKRGVKFPAWKRGDPMPSVTPGSHEHAYLDHGPTAVLTYLLADRRPVVDHLGLSGTYLYFVRWDDMYPGALRGNAVKQLGLKLKSGMAPVDVLVIDRFEKPDAN